MYISWNDFNVGSGPSSSTYSTDDGRPGTPRVTVINAATFIRNVQITGDVANGDVYIAGMDEGGGGFPHND